MGQVQALCGILHTNSAQWSLAGQHATGHFLVIELVVVVYLFAVTFGYKISVAQIFLDSAGPARVQYWLHFCYVVSKLLPVYTKEKLIPFLWPHIN